MLIYEGCRIRLIENKDLEQVLAWRNSEHIRASMYTDQLITMDQHRAWFNRLQQEKQSVCLIFEYENTPAGVINFTNFDVKNNKCNWGFYLGEKNMPPGTGTNMGLLGLEYAFNELGFRKITGEAFAFNIASIRLHEKLGFMQEGMLKQHVLKNGKYEDIVVFALFKDEFEARRR